MKKELNLSIFLILTTILSYSQNDTIHLSDGTFMVGEIKSLARGILTIETDCSENDFQVDADKIIGLNSSQNFIVILDDGQQFEGTINETDSAYIEIVFEDRSGVIVDLDKVIELRSFDKKTFDRFSAYIDFGFSLTKANNLNQYSLRSGGSYKAKRWVASINVNSLRSSQDSVAPTERNDGNLGLDYLMRKNWFLQSRYSWLQNNEQNLKLRTITSGGIGKYLFNTSKLYWSLSTGAAWVNESFLPIEGSIQPDKESGETYLSTELNLFDMNDLSLLTNYSFFPSITERGRLRFDWTFNLKYDLPLDFYIGLGTTVNYDNSPATGASELDYVIQSTIGWEL